MGYSSSQSPVTSHQSPVTSHQSPVPSHQSPVPSPQSPVTYNNLSQSKLDPTLASCTRLFGSSKKGKQPKTGM
ncbi:MAG: hypothetical protein ACKPEO_17435 [Sphaerospermopsis kisseleviana]